MTRHNRISPHVSVAAIEGIVNGVAPPPDLLAWSSRTTQPREGGFRACRKGASAIVIGEVEKLLAECGVTAELMTDAGLSTDESKRLLYALYVHSSGFLQFLADSFSDLPQRQTLLKHVGGLRYANRTCRDRRGGRRRLFVCYGRTVSRDENDTG